MGFREEEFDAMIYDEEIEYDPITDEYKVIEEINKEPSCWIDTTDEKRNSTEDKDL
jgi:hypothetical protein